MFKSCNPDQGNYNVMALSSSGGAVSISNDILKGLGFKSLRIQRLDSVPGSYSQSYLHLYGGLAQLVERVKSTVAIYSSNDEAVHNGYFEIGTPRSQVQFLYPPPRNTTMQQIQLLPIIKRLR